MTSTHTIPKLNSNTVKTIQDDMLAICLAYYLGCDYELTFQKLKNSRSGFKRKALDTIAQSGPGGIERIAAVLIAPI